jgi:hypothetical protein
LEGVFCRAHPADYAGRSIAQAEACDSGLVGSAHLTQVFAGVTARPKTRPSIDPRQSIRALVIAVKGNSPACRVELLATGGGGHPVKRIGALLHPTNAPIIKTKGAVHHLRGGSAAGIMGVSLSIQ